MTSVTLTEPRYSHQSLAYQQTISDGATGDAIPIYPGPVTVSIYPGTSGRVEYTTSLPSKVAAGTAQWQIWSNGVVTAASTDIPQGPITGVRGVSVAGIAVLEVLQ